MAPHRWDVCPFPTPGLPLGNVARKRDQKRVGEDEDRRRRLEHSVLMRRSEQDPGRSDDFDRVSMSDRVLRLCTCLVPIR